MRHLLTLRTPLLATLIGCTLLAVASAQTSEPLPFPGVLIGPGEVSEVLEFETDLAVVDALTDLGRVSLRGVPMPTGQILNLDLERVEFQWGSLGVYVDGVRAEYDPGDSSCWKGKVVGVEGSEVFLSFSSLGSYGWIHDGVDYTHLSAMLNADGEWEGARMRLYSDKALNAAGQGLGARGMGTCLSDQLQSGHQPPPAINPADLSPPTYGAAQKLECKMAIETDNQLYKKWNNLSACENYVFALLAAISDRYDTQIDTILTFPYVQFWTTASDPWNSQDSGGSSSDLLTEFQNAWAGNIPNGAHLAHFVSGANLGGGVAWLGVLCNQTYGFAVSGNIDGGVTFPVTQGSNTWDFMVVAHETGHNFGAPHTHDYCPPLDKCYTNCTGSTQCTNQGTIMSYCHLCGGGMNNITTYFHPSVVSTMRSGAVSSCIPNWNSNSFATVFYDDFEVGGLAANGWTKVNARRKSDSAHEGNKGAKVRKSGSIQRTVDTSGFGEVVVRYWRKTKNYDAGEELRLRYSTNGGSSWTTAGASDAISWGFVEYAMPSSAGNNANFMIMFKSFGGDEPKENGRMDQVEVLGR
jgi:hypothetical protein